MMMMMMVPFTYSALLVQGPLCFLHCGELEAVIYYYKLQAKDYYNLQAKDFLQLAFLYTTINSQANRILATLPFYILP